MQAYRSFLYGIVGLMRSFRTLLSPVCTVPVAASVHGVTSLRTSMFSNIVVRSSDLAALARLILKPKEVRAASIVQTINNTRTIRTNRMHYYFQFISVINLKVNLESK